MAVGAYVVGDIRNIIIAGVVLTLQTAQAHGYGNVEFIDGIVTLAKHQAHSFGIPWSLIKHEALASLGRSYEELLE